MISDTVIVGFAFTLVGLTVRELPAIVVKFWGREPKNGSNGNGANGQSVLLWQNANKQIFTDTLKIEVLPVLNRQTEILESVANTNTAIKDAILELVVLERERKR